MSAKKSRETIVAEHGAITLDREMPHSFEAEKGVLGCILLSPKECLAETLERFQNKEAFYDHRHQAIMAAIEALDKKHKPPALIVLQQHLKDVGLLDQVGGLAYLSELQDAVPSAHNLSYYLDIVWEKYQLRRAIIVCVDVVGRVYGHERDVDGLMDAIESDILSIRGNVKSESRNLDEVVGKVLDNLDSIMANKGIKDSLTTGYPRLDRMLASGLCGSKLVVVAARPSQGKTAFGMNIVEHIAIDCKIPVGVFSLEMEAEELILRMVCSRSGVNFVDVGGDNLHPDSPRAMNKAANEIKRSPIHVDDTGGLTVNQIKARARRMVQRHKVKLIVVDYLQLMSGQKRSKENRQAEIADISKEMKALAKELRIPVIVMSQLNRDLEKDKGRCPRLSDLRESGAIEQDADIVLMIWEQKLPERNDPDGDQPDEVPIKIFIAKQRGGPKDKYVPLTFQKQYTRFVNPEKQKPDMDDMPYNTEPLFE